MNEILRERLKLIDRIDHLNSLHPPTERQVCSDADCGICPELRGLGAKYEALTIRRREEKHSPTERTKEIIAKGEDATRSEIEFLLTKAKMTKAEVAKALGIYKNGFLKICDMWGIGRINKREKVG